MAFIDDLRHELIEDGHASKLLLDYIDERIQEYLEKALVNCIGDIEENLWEKIKESKHAS